MNAPARNTLSLATRERRAKKPGVTQKLWTHEQLLDTWRRNGQVVDVVGTPDSPLQFSLVLVLEIDRFALLVQPVRVKFGQVELSGPSTLVFKHAISSIVPVKGVSIA